MENLPAICRACLKKEENMNLLFSSYDGTKTYAQILEEVLGLTQIIKGEEYSDRLCKGCTRLLLDFKSFKTVFQQATEYFKSKVGDLQLSKSFADDYFQDSPISSPDHKINSDCVNSNKNCTSNIQSNCHPTQKCKGEPDHDVIKLESPSETNSEKTTCKICKKIFLLNEFDDHFETHKSHKCKTCGHKFVRKTDLNDHEEIHSDVFKYVCQHCGKAFKVRTALNKHRRIHTHPREEICEVCGQRFNTRDTLKTHYKLKHIKAKDFQCNLCGLAFTLKSTLERHIGRHNPNRIKSYSCSMCDMSYINKYNLSRHHIIKHTSIENRPACEFCGKRYTKKFDLIKHVKKQHGQNDEVEICKVEVAL